MEIINLRTLKKNMTVKSRQKKIQLKSEMDGKKIQLKSTL